MASLLGGPDERKRDEWEGRLTRLASSTLAKKFAELRQSLGDGTQVPETFWGELETELSEAILPTLGEVARHSASRLEASVPEEKKSQAITLNIETDNHSGEWVSVLRGLMEQQALAIKANTEAIGALAKAIVAQHTPQVTVQVEPTPIHVEPPSVMVNAPEVVMPEAVKAQGQSSPTSRDEIHKIVRNQKGEISGSEVHVEYRYGGE